MVQFNQIRNNLRVPLFYAEFNAGASPYQSISRLLLIGQMTSAGSATPAVAAVVDGDEEALFGPGSHADRMFKIARRNAAFQEIWVLPLADAGGATAATGKITVSAAPTKNGELSVFIAGIKVRIGVNTSQTAVQVAAALVVAINLETSLPVTALQSVVEGEEDEVLLTAKNKGTLGNFIRVEIDLDGDAGPLPALMLTIAAMASGATDPNMTTALTSLGNDEFDAIASGFTDATNLGAIAALLNDQSGRWSPISQLYGHYFSAKDASAGDLTTFGNAKNDQHMTVMGYKASPTPPWEWAAAIGAVAIAHLQDAPEVSRPLHTLALLGVRRPKLKADEFSLTTRQTLYYDGISGYHVRRDGTVCIDRLITTYQTNVWNSPDPTYLSINTMFQAVFAVRFMKQLVTQEWGRAALRETDPFGIQGVCTPAKFKDTCLHGYRQLSILNVVENEEAFAIALIVEINASNPDRIDTYLPLDHVNQLTVAGFNVTSFLKLPAAA